MSNSPAIDRLQAISDPVKRLEACRVYVSYGSGRMYELSWARTEVRNILRDQRVNSAKLKVPSMIAEAVRPLKGAAVAGAMKSAREYLDRTFLYLAKQGWDLDRVAPEPNRHADRTGYNRALQVRGFFRMITVRDEQANERVKQEYKGLLRRGGFGILHVYPNYLMRDAAREEEYVKQAGEDAAAAFEAYVCKLETKVGENTKASVEGQLWTGSVLTVETPKGEQRWHTQHIINYSVYGKPYNQWPTRLMKGGK